MTVARPAAILNSMAGSTAGEVVLAYLADQVRSLTDLAEGVRQDAPDAVHQARVAARRVRTTLRVFRRLLHRGRTDPLRAELRWYAGVLGGVRDAEVTRDRLLADVEELPRHLADRLRPQASAGLIRAASETAYGSARREALTALGTDRYARLVRDLDLLVADPPWRGRAAGAAESVLPPLAGRAARRVHGVAALGWQADGELRAELLHETRKKAKAVRYACDALVPLLGDPAQRAALAWEAVTDALGLVQDSRSAQQRLVELLPASAAAGPTLGVLLGVEVERGRYAEESARAVLGRVPTGWR